MRPGQYVTKKKASLQGRLASCPLVLFSYYTLPIAYEEYLMNRDKDLDLAELWYGVESIVFVARAAPAAGHQGHQHLRAEGFDKHRSLGTTDQKKKRTMMRI